MLVLDDYRVITEPSIHEAIEFLLEHQPLQTHLVIITRQDCSLPLSHLRARGQLTEIRQDDLRFTHEQAAAFLNSSMGLSLTASEIEALEERTESWVQGLQSAALALPLHLPASFLDGAVAGHETSTRRETLRAYRRRMWTEEILGDMKGNGSDRPTPA